ncbi:MAG TPA: SDR family NAD(P)-dependent oxidoreductase [Acidimicrobiales bacterium]|nr:SDR family NAD(P)-dependent oxidoreductase [Acidimicrobiales bacterium]
MVTGASSGIGREAAVRLARDGARVWAVARNEGRLRQLAATQPGIVPLRADVSVEHDRAALVDAVAAEGPLDVLVNNAGLGWTGLVEDMPAAEVRALFEINVLGLIDLTQRVLPGMLERRRGHIVNVGSAGGWVAVPPITVYSATKFAVAGFTEGLRREVQGRGVTVSLVSPGPLRTEFLGRAQGVSDDQGVPVTGGSPLPGSLGARAIVASIRRSGLPGWSTIAVPRPVGLTRLGALPGVDRLVDAGALVSRLPGFLRRPGGGGPEAGGGGADG